jgi:hypothetical protein
MQIIAPSYITDSNLTFCDIPATDSGTSEWDSTTSYVTGQRVVVNYLIDGVTPGVHRIYECTWHGTGNVNMYPPDHLNVESSYIWWTRVSATNRWRLFDLIVAPDRATVTTNVLPTVWASGEVWESGTSWAQESYAGMRVDTTPGLIDSIAVMNANCTNLSLIMTNAGVEVYREEKISSTVTDYNGVFTGLPAYPSATVSVSVRNSAGDLKIGEIIFGNARTIGTAKYGVDVGLIDYSQKDVDAFGNFSILERSYSKRIACQFTMAAANHSGILRLLEKYRSVPLVWIISDLYSTTITYGFYRDLQVSIPYPTMAEGSVNIEGLGADYVHAEVIPDPWVPVWDGIIKLILTVPTVSVATAKIEEAPMHVDTIAMSVPAVPTLAAPVLAQYVWIGNCTISQAEPGVVTCVAHGLADTAPIFFQTDGALPAPISAGDYKTNIYYVRNHADDTFNISATVGGYLIDTTNAGSGTHKLMNGTPS